REPQAKTQEPRIDLLGDPLPRGAIARLGSVRLYHGYPVERVVLSPNGKWIVSSAGNGNRLWDARTGKESILRDEFKAPHVFDTADNLVVVTLQPGNLHLWDITAGKELVKLSVEMQIARSAPIGLSPDCKTLVCWSTESVDGALVFKLYFVDAATGKTRGSVDPKCTSGVYSAAFSADGKMLLTHFADNSLAVWDVPKLASRWST